MNARGLDRRKNLRKKERSSQLGTSSAQLSTCVMLCVFRLLKFRASRPAPSHSRPSCTSDAQISPDSIARRRASASASDMEPRCFVFFGRYGGEWAQEWTQEWTRNGVEVGGVVLLGVGGLAWFEKREHLLAWENSWVVLPF